MNNSEQILEYISYEPLTGVCHWQISPGGGIRKGAVAGHCDSAFHTIRFRGKLYLTHRIAWRIVKGYWPEKFIDHFDLNPLNNRFDNLREATQSQNCANVRVRSTSVSRLKGVGYNTHAKKWKAKIKANGRQVHLGYFTSAEAAYAAYCSAAIKVYGKFARLA